MRSGYVVGHEESRPQPRAIDGALDGSVGRDRPTHTPAHSLVLGLISAGLGLVVWQLLALSHALASYMLPAPSAVAREWWLLARNGVLWRHVGATLQEALLGFALAFVVGVVIAYPVAKSRVAASVLSPYIAATQAMPILALAPLLTVWF